ncbi:DUF614 domain-containing protein [Histoplasma capsulatum H143]|uniref:DUF614 domain-containing protein n=1 Tax=Ajellomyces capsulatus (strain H143) TaxID=544712 RepID=C6HDV7_AJECH|nr:DUF614 domain-containing protein [Histoplasma capsulatum H143]
MSKVISSVYWASVVLAFSLEKPEVVVVIGSAFLFAVVRVLFRRWGAPRYGISSTLRDGASAIGVEHAVARVVL